MGNLPFWSVVPALALLAGIGLLIWGTFVLARTLVFLARAVKFPGEVVDMEAEPSEEGLATTRPVVSYVSSSGRPATFSPKFFSSRPTHEIGEKVVVLFEPDRPDEPRLRSFGDLWLAPIVLLGVGAIVSAMGAALLSEWFSP